MDNKTVALYDIKEIRKAIKVLFSDVKFGNGECIEVRLFDKNKGLTVSGWFDDVEVMAKRIAIAARDGVKGDSSYRFVQDNIYWTINPVDDALLSRQVKNELTFVKESTSDNNITRRLWFPIDVDPKRPAGVSASKEERGLALEVANDMFRKLEALGFTDNMFVGGTSGNGYHCLIRVDLPNDKDTADFLRNCLKGLSELVGTGKVDIDPKVFNASRILKAYGSIARKGVHNDSRPWRMSKLTVVPDEVVVAPRELLEKLAALAPAVNTKRVAAQKPQGPWTEENTQAYIDNGTDWACTKRGGKIEGEVCRWMGRCVFDPNHTDAAIILHDDGWWSYGCFHASCDGYRHEQFKAYWAEHHGKYAYPTNHKPQETFKGFEVDNVDDLDAEEIPAEMERTKEIPLYRLTDAGNMERLKWRYEDKFLFCPQRDWFAWDDRRWRPDSTRAIIGAALKTTRQICKAELNRALEAFDGDDKAAEKLEERYRHWEDTSEGKARLEAMCGLAECFMAVELNRFDTDKMLFNCANGTINLRTNEIYPARREDYITVRSTVEYDPLAECPLWLSFLSDVTADNDELMRYLQRAIGYSLTGLTAEHCMFILWGNGRNGKSTFLEVIHRLMGEYAKAAHMNTFMQKKNDEGVPNDLAMLSSARFVSATESDDGKRLAEGKIKQITGGDTVTARFLHKEFFEFTPQFKIWLGTNHKPTIYGTDEGIWRRIKLIPFTVYIPDNKKDETLKDKLLSELPGILNWALRGLEEYRLNGMMEPDIVKATTDDYRESQDWMTRFLEETTELSLDDAVSARKLYEAYTRWCDRTGEFKLKEVKFAEGMKQKGHASRRKRQADGKTIAVYEGFRLRDTLAAFGTGEYQASVGFNDFDPGAYGL